MLKYPRHMPVDMKKYTPTTNNPEAFYGLPQNVLYCHSCVISNQRPNSSVEFKHTRDSEKATIHLRRPRHLRRLPSRRGKAPPIDWDKRDKQLRELCDQHRQNDGSYDCLVPGSGGKDSFYAAHVLKYKYGMHPLTVTWAPHVYTDWGWKNFQAWIHAGFDNYLCTPNGRMHRLLTRLAVENLFHPFQPFILGQKNLAPKMALLHDIPLVFYGENEAEYGNPHRRHRQREARLVVLHAQDKPPDLSRRRLGRRPEQAVRRSTLADLRPYLPADPEQLEAKKVEVHYLGYYLKWHPQSCYYYSVEHGGFQATPERTPGTYSKYNSIDDRIDDFHYFTTFIKFGIGRATYDAAQEIRSRRHHARRRRRAGQALRRRMARAVCRGDFRLSEHSREGIPGREQALRTADHGPAILPAPGRPLPLAAPVEVRGWRMAAASQGVGKHRRPDQVI